MSEVAKNLLLEKMHYQCIAVMVDSQAAIKALIKCTVTSITVLNCIRNLNQVGKHNHGSIAWIPGHAGAHGNEVAHYVAKSGSKSKIHGPEPFITVPYASCVSAIKDGPQIDGNLSGMNERLLEDEVICRLDVFSTNNTSP